MFFRSLFWERTVLSLLEKVQELPLNVQADIAKRVGGYIAIASTTHEAGSLERFAAAAVKERGKSSRRGSSPHWTNVGPRPHLLRHGAWRGWGLQGSLNRHSAMAVSLSINRSWSLAKSSPDVPARCLGDDDAGA